MQSVVKDLKVVLEGIEGYHDSYLSEITEALKDKVYIYQRAYPIALVHHESRVDESRVVGLLQERGLLDSEGFTTTTWSKESLEFLQHSCEEYLQEATMMVLKTPPSYPQRFTGNFPKDRWKKLQDIAQIVSTIEMAAFGEEVDKCGVEFYLREVMRKRKEVRRLKEVGYLYIAQVPKSVREVEEVFQHYFQDNVIVVEHEYISYFVGWNEKLKDINMRYFLCLPR